MTFRATTKVNERRMKMKCRVIQFAMLVVLGTLLVVGSATAGQIVHYTADQGSGAVLQDTAGWNNWAYLRNGVSYVPDPWGGSALSLDGVNDYVDLYGAQLAVGSEIIDSIEATGAIEFWYYAPQAAPYGNYVDVRHTAAGAGWANHGIMMNSGNWWNPPENNREINTISQGGPTIGYGWARDSTDGAGTPLDRDVWTHKVLTWSQYAGGTLMWEFVNGVQTSYIGVGLMGGPEISGMSWWFGRTYGNGNAYFTGRMDEISIWNTRMSAGTALARYEAGVASMLPGMIPEPGSLLALSMGLVGLVGTLVRRRR